MFFPRGGSAHVVRSLARHLPDHGWETSVLSGSWRGHGDARRFFRTLPRPVVDYPGAAPAPAPLRHAPPFHPSYEDRPAAPDPVFAKLDDELCERQVAAWS